MIVVKNRIVYFSAFSICCLVIALVYLRGKKEGSVFKNIYFYIKYAVSKKNSELVYLYFYKYPYFYKK